MRGTVHCLGVFLLCSGSLGLACMLSLALHALEQTFRVQPIAVGLSRSPVPPIHQVAHERVPFVMRP